MGILRLLLAVLVLVDHARGMDSYSNFGIYGAVPAVKFFFLISGFYMAMVLNEKYPSAGPFYLARMWRLAPAYFAIVILTMIASPSFVSGARLSALDVWMNFGVVGSEVPQWACLIVSNETCAAISPKVMYVPQIWSVSVELQFYLLAPFLARSRAALTIALAITAGFYIVLDVLHINHDWDRVVTLPQLLFFCLGMASYLIYKGWNSELSKLWWSGPLAFAGAFGSIIWIALRRPYLGDAAGSWEIAIGILLAALLPSIFAWTRDSTRDRAIGDLSYPFYLAHLLVISVAVSALTALGLAGWWDLAVYAVATLFLSAAVAYLIEWPSEIFRAQCFRTLSPRLRHP